MDQAVSVNADPYMPSDSEGHGSRWRNWSGFWLLGLCNNFAYVVMLSAAHDILKQQGSHNSTSPTPATVALHVEGGNGGNRSSYDCNPVSTAAVLLADILPTLLIKLSAPFFIHKLPYGFRVLVCVATAIASFLVVSFSSTVWMSTLGVIFASVSSGLGELSFLSLTVFFSRDVLGGWGSGTGGAGVAGALLYSALTQAGLSPRDTLLIMLVVPVAMVISYFFLLVFPPSFPQWKCREAESVRGGDSQSRRPLLDGSDEEEEEEREKGAEGVFIVSTCEDKVTGPLTLIEKLHVIKGLLRFVVPLGVVYFAEYFINQGLLELLYFPKFNLSHAEQYRWYQTLYQVGVLVSRSSLCCVKISRIWALSLLQCVNAVLLFLSVYYQLLPSAWLVFVIVIYEGLLGGAAYVNTFYFISKETGDRQREFAMATASVGDSLGIAISGLIAFPVHRYFCSL
ncbi:battenin isoform X1 [Coregonus clupeaformis]|uniref:battenin isoform X1 n=1 Tax=Coregonus clupeaformis TaxID=59861 RepID=UPI001BDF8785|nr:battenin isoform X1 [Coregonus clupeaformis]